MTTTQIGTAPNRPSRASLHVFSPTDAARARRRATLWNGCARAVIWATSIVVVALWISGQGIQSVLGFDAESLNSLSRLAGLVSANLLLYQVLLMARIPLFENGFGRDTITRFHRVVGIWSVVLLAMHAVLIVVGYALQDGLNWFAEASDMLWNYPGMLLAFVGTTLVLGVAVTSARRSRRRMRYESWHLLHLYAYLGVGMAVPHMLWTGADFLNSPAATVYWWGLWIATAAAVVIFRVLRPLWRTARAGLRVVQVRPDGNSAVALRVQGRGVARLAPQPGQFFVWRFLDGAGWSRGHPFSLAAAPTDTEMELSARIVGDGTRRLARVRPGTRVMVEGPYGLFTNAQRRHSRVLMLGAGAGVAPLVSLLEAGAWLPGQAVLVTRDHDPAARIRSEQIARLASHRGLQHFVLDGPRSQGRSGWVSAAAAGWDGAELLRYFMPTGGASDVFVCGPEPWMRSVIRDLRRLGVPAQDIHSELFTV